MAAAKRKTGAHTAGKEGRADNITPLRPPRPCPVCGKTSTREFHPFCSRHCADVDLNRWLTGAYAIPVVEEDGSIPEGGDGEGT